jgi:hypothetical protein
MIADILHSGWTFVPTMPQFVLPLLAALVAVLTLRWLFRSTVEAMSRFVESLVGGPATYMPAEPVSAPEPPRASAMHPSPAE